ncbi:murein biosynthesis integral membrane protein MurJ [Candidatus Saccharibacteria bacterium 32-49-12]|nr:MAG: murein biosynthesis integral membrane protein MurJ [Candidatus Saccharibacteria bacterium 32-49-12]
MQYFRKTISRLNKRLSLKLAASLLAGSTLIASLLGFLRDRIFNTLYYTTYPTGADAYTVAFAVPDFMFVILVSGALSVSFIPVFNQRLNSGNKRSAWELSTSILNLMALATLAASILMIIFAEPLVRYVVGPGLDESSRALASSMMRVMAVSPFLFAVATVLTSMQQAVGRFAFFALAPAVYNIGILIGLMYFTDGITLFGQVIFEGGIMGVALGVVLGAMLQLIVSSLGLIGMGFDYQFKIFWKNKGFRRVLRLLPPRSLDQGIDYINSIVEINLASRMVASSVRAYQQATTLAYMPINLIGVAISTAAYPKMTERLVEGRPDLFKAELISVLRVIIWLALPVAVLFFFARGYVVNFIVNGGDPYMASILGVLAIGIVFRSIYFISARSFYAQQDTRTPMYISFFTIGANIVLAVWLSMGLDMGVEGLAWAVVITSILEVTILFYLMSKRIQNLFDAEFLHAVGRMAISAFVAGIITYLMVLMVPLEADDNSIWITFPKFALISAVSFAAYFAFSYLMRLSETKPIVGRFKQIYYLVRKMIARHVS